MNDHLMTIEYRVTFNSGDTEQITTSGKTYNACITAALKAATKRFNRDGSRDDVTGIELWERRA